ncbi:hypothetical protein EJB05_21386, partial [Eragrostis curvula]
SGSFFSISTFPSSPLVSAPFSPPASNLAVLLSLRWIGIFLGSPGIAEHMADEEPSDPKALLEERSKAKCVSQWYEYQLSLGLLEQTLPLSVILIEAYDYDAWIVATQKCVKRIADDETGQKHCTGQYFDYWQCVDKNVAEKLFQKLK